MGLPIGPSFNWSTIATKKHSRTKGRRNKVRKIVEDGSSSSKHTTPQFPDGTRLPHLKPVSCAVRKLVPSLGAHVKITCTWNAEELPDTGYNTQPWKIRPIPWPIRPLY